MEHRTPPPAPAKPRLRGVVHQGALLFAAAAAAALIAAAPTDRARLAAAIYGLTLCGLLAASAAYHRPTWPPRTRRWLRRLDHSMIFMLIAGTYTPFALLVLSEPLSTVVLAVVWGGALAGVTLTLLWVDAPKALTAAVCIALGWVAVAALPQMAARAGAAAVALVAAGGVLYTLGAIAYASGRPDPWPRTFGYHEVFHVLVVLAAACHFVAVAVYAVGPGA